MREVPLCLGSIYSFVCFKGVASSLLCLVDGQEEVKEQDGIARQVIVLPFLPSFTWWWLQTFLQEIDTSNSLKQWLLLLSICHLEAHVNPSHTWALSDLFCIIFFLRGMLFLGYMLFSWLADCQSKERRVHDASSGTGELKCTFYKTEFW